jgi:hypothetical protein
MGTGPQSITVTRLAELAAKMQVDSLYVPGNLADLDTGSNTV